MIGAVALKSMLLDIEFEKALGKTIRHQPVKEPQLSVQGPVFGERHDGAVLNSTQSQRAGLVGKVCLCVFKFVYTAQLHST